LTRALIVIAVLVLAALATAGWMKAGDGLAAQREAIHSEWPNVATALERRAELTANLAQTVKAVASAADPVFDDIAQARAALSSGGSSTNNSTVQQEIQANSRLMEACARLFLLAERYPKLTSDREYKRIGEELKEAENAVAIERRKYNELLEHYNAQLRRFPDNIVARISGFSRIDAYVITEEEVR
jgi:LemA protein